MIRTKLILLFLAFTSVGAGVLAWRQHAALVALRAASMDRDERSEWQRKVRELERQNLEQQAQLAVARSTIGSGTVAEAGSRRGPREKGGEATGAASGEEALRERAGSVAQQAAAIRELMNKPDVQAMLTVQKKAAIDQRYADLFKTLNLPPSQIEKLKALLEERSNTMQDMIAAARDQGVNLRANPEARKLVTDTQNQLNEGIKAAIGESGFAQLTSYERTIPQRNLVGDLEQRLSYTPTPLTAAQAGQLVQILAANPPQRTATSADSPAGGASGAGRLDTGAIVRNAMATVPGVGLLLGSADDSGRQAIPSYPISPSALSQAQAVLSRPQLAALQQLQQQQQAQAQLRNLVTETLVKNQPPPAPPRPRGGG